MISIKNSTYKYKQKLALSNINLDIEKGESVALIGQNGCGKSTLLKVINGLYFLEEGTYTFEGNNINEKTMKKTKFSKEFHKRIGCVFQNSEVQLFCSTVYDEIAFGPRMMGLDDNEVSNRVEDILSLLNIKKLKNDITYQLSGGEKKKVAIGATLAVNPIVLTLDEPFSGIDPKGKKFLKNLFIDLNKAGKTIICATHDLDYLKGLFKRAIVFSEDHKVIRDGEYNDIVNDEEFLEAHNII